MKTTIELPDDLFRQLKMKAVQEGRSMKDLLTELLRREFTAKPQKAGKRSFPIIRGGRPAKKEEEMTPDRVAEILWGRGE